MVNISEEITRLSLRHNKLVAFFQDLKVDRHKNRQEYVDKAVHYLEPIDIRDIFKELIKKFNKSLNLILPGEPISIIDVEKFQEEIEKTKDPKTKELKRANRLKHKIRGGVGLKMGIWLYP